MLARALLYAALRPRSARTNCCCGARRGPAAASPPCRALASPPAAPQWRLPRQRAGCGPACSLRTWRPPWHRAGSLLRGRGRRVDALCSRCAARCARQASRPTLAPHLGGGALALDRAERQLMRSSMRAPGVSAVAGLANRIGCLALDRAERTSMRSSMRAPGVAVSTGRSGFTGGTGSSG